MDEFLIILGIVCALFFLGFVSEVILWIKYGMTWRAEGGAKKYFKSDGWLTKTLIIINHVMPFPALCFGIYLLIAFHDQFPPAR